MILGVPREIFPGERRVAITPAVVPPLIKAGLEIVIETQAGAAAGYPDEQFESRGVKIAPSRQELFSRADIVAQVLACGSNDKNGRDDLPLMRKDQVLIGFMRPLAARN